MKAIGNIITAPLKLLGVIPSKAPTLPAPPLTPQRDDARAAVDATDALRRRRGGAADILTGQGGAEAAPTGKQTLGS